MPFGSRLDPLHGPGALTTAAHDPQPAAVGPEDAAGWWHFDDLTSRDSDPGAVSLGLDRWITEGHWIAWFAASGRSRIWRSLAYLTASLMQYWAAPNDDAA